MTSSSSSLQPLLPLEPRKIYIIDEEDIHRPMGPGEAVTDGDGLDLYLNGLMPYIELQEYDNQQPQEGDIWLHNNKLYFHTCGQTFEIPYGIAYRWDEGDWDIEGHHWD